ncbi:YadA-like family protein [Dyella mobilis]|uniref:YadA-like family protein n=1 Tax=Dyella mobilis TaxID=1849582 RepID=A0ABS2KM12_9GAMM|nr:YadA-like family protein [Dyella mobilis]MBM7132201.1 YadA-like family protein [Dyella mobilis]
MSSLSMSAVATDVGNEARCSAETSDDQCSGDTLSSGGFRANSGAIAPIGINGGGFDGRGTGIAIDADGGTSSTNTAADIAIGNGATAVGVNGSGSAIAIGANANAGALFSVALGENASATAEYSVALGSNSVADSNNTVSVGDAGSDLYRQIVNMAAGVEANDAVNVSQLTPVITSIGGSIDSATGEVTMPTFTVQDDNGISTVADAVTALDSAVSASNASITSLTDQVNDGTLGLVRQSAAGAPITVAGSKDGTVVDFTNNANATRTLTGVSAGNLAANSTDVVNGSQLFTTNGNVLTNTTNIASLQSQIDNLGSGETGLVQQVPSTNIITVGAGTGGTVVSFANNAGNGRVVTGVADGALDGSSVQAVNGSQLNDTNQAVTALDTRVSAAEGDITNIKDTLKNLGDGLASGIQYDDATTKSQVTLGGASGTVIGNVAAGSIASGSMEAINGGQLSAIQDNLQSQIGGLNDRMNDIADGLGNVGSGFDGDLNNERITNLAPGIADTDAANLGQVKEAAANAVSTANAYTDTKFNALNQDLQNFKGEVNDRFNRQDQRIDRIGAMSAANTQMAINAGGVESTGKGRLAVGVGLQNSRAALAVGYANKVSDRVRMSFGAAVSGSEASVGAGAGFDL